MKYVPEAGDKCQTPERKPAKLPNENQPNNQTKSSQKTKLLLKSSCSSVIICNFAPEKLEYGRTTDIS